MPQPSIIAKRKWYAGVRPKAVLSAKRAIDGPARLIQEAMTDPKEISVEGPIYIKNC